MKKKTLYTLLCTTIMVGNTFSMDAKQVQVDPSFSTPSKSSAISRVQAQDSLGFQTPNTLDAVKKKKEAKAEIFLSTPQIEAAQKKKFDKTTLDSASKELFTKAATQLARKERDETLKAKYIEIDQEASKNRVARDQEKKEKLYQEEAAENKKSLEELTEKTEAEKLELERAIIGLADELKRINEETKLMETAKSQIEAELLQAKTFQPLATEMITQLTVTLKTAEEEYSTLTSKQQRTKEALQMAEWERDQEKAAKDSLAKRILELKQKGSTSISPQGSTSISPQISTSVPLVRQEKEEGVETQQEKKEGVVPQQEKTKPTRAPKSNIGGGSGTKDDTQ